MTLCTKQKALWLFEEDKTLTPPTDFKLGTLCQYFDVRLRKEDAHDALVDVRATVKLYQAMCEHQRRQFAVAA
jgi:DNA polymerase III epsilon subunit-like protein